jgi:adenylosuccinate lyase
MIHANERDGAAWALEWENIPQMIQNTGTALGHALTITDNLQFNEIAIKKNLDLLNGLVYSEVASFVLSKYMPRDKAKMIVEKACERVVLENKNLTEILTELTPDIAINWHEELKVEKHLGVSAQIIATVLEQIKPIL